MKAPMLATRRVGNSPRIKIKNTGSLGPIFSYIPRMKNNNAIYTTGSYHALYSLLEIRKHGLLYH